MLVRFVRIVLMVGNKVVVAGGAGGDALLQLSGPCDSGLQNVTKRQDVRQMWLASCLF